jgi:hypothetical protein
MHKTCTSSAVQQLGSPLPSQVPAPVAPAGRGRAPPPPCSYQCRRRTASLQNAASPLKAYSTQASTGLGTRSPSPCVDRASLETRRQVTSRPSSPRSYSARHIERLIFPDDVLGTAMRLTTTTSLGTRPKQL